MSNVSFMGLRVALEAYECTWVRTVTTISANNIVSLNAVDLSLGVIVSSEYLTRIVPFETVH